MATKMYEINSKINSLNQFHHNIDLLYDINRYDLDRKKALSFKGGGSIKLILSKLNKGSKKRKKSRLDFLVSNDYRSHSYHELELIFLGREYGQRMILAHNNGMSKMKFCDYSVSNYMAYRKKCSNALNEDDFKDRFRINVNLGIYDCAFGAKMRHHPAEQVITQIYYASSNIAMTPREMHVVGLNRIKKPLRYAFNQKK